MSRLIGTFAQFLSVYLISQLGGEVLGPFLVISAWAYLLGIFSTLGLHTYVLRECSLISSVNKEDNVIVPSSIIVLCVSILVGLVGEYLLKSEGLLFITVVSMAMLKILSEYMKTLQFTAIPLFIEYSLSPVVFCILLYLGSQTVFMAFTLSFVFSFLCMLMLLTISCKDRKYSCQFTRFKNTLNYKDIISLFLVGWVNNIEVHIPVIIVGFIFGDLIAAEFGIGARISFFIFTLSSVIGAIYGPKLSVAYKQGHDLLKIYTDARKATLFLFSPVIILVFTAGESLISLFLVPTDIALYSLYIMVLFKISVGFFGPVDYLAAMTNKASYDVNSAFIVFSISIPLALFFGYSGSIYLCIFTLGAMSALRSANSYRILHKLLRS